MPIINNTDLKPRKSTNQSLEIKDVKWFKYNEAQSKIFIQNIERKELLKRINHAIVKNIINP
jgi:NADH pyrophosphatase NudC (nudix superfamily)